MIVSAVHASARHSFSKSPQTFIELVAGHGVAGDAHYGAKVKHRSRVRRDPTQPNLRQVHLIHAELYAELSERGFSHAYGTLGENITTKDIDLLALSRGTLLDIGEARLEVTGLRNPCSQLDALQPGLTMAVLDYDENGELIRKAGIMAIVLQGGLVYPGDTVQMTVPEKHISLKVV